VTSAAEFSGPTVLRIALLSARLEEIAGDSNGGTLEPRTMSVLVAITAVVVLDGPLGSEVDQRVSGGAKDEKKHPKIMIYH
jgi:hypothetical protein